MSMIHKAHSRLGYVVYYSEHPSRAGEKADG
jgi:hypothetical protein